MMPERRIMGLLINIDNGGTFTDVCVTDGTRIFHAKSTTTPHDLTQCFVEALRKASRDVYGEEDLGQLIRDTDYLRYSTTSGTNAVVERKGSPVALLVEAGEEDAVYGAAARADDGSLWKSMVPNRPAGIRVGADGSVAEAELTAVVNQMLADGAQRLAIVLRNPAVEQRVKDILLERYPRHLLGAIPFLLSYEVVNDPDHARRTGTAVINSYLHPGMEHFLYGAENVCKLQRMRRPLLIFRNDGNSSRVAKTTAVKTWGSGPRGGLEGTLAYARLYDAPTMLAMDIGGTTTDVSVAVGGSIALRAYGQVDDVAMSFPMPALHSVGLGGSSVITVASGKIVIGPESVGAAPGPACFGRGGTHATLTDALLLAGVLDPARYLGGTLALDVARAEAAIEANVGKPLGLALPAAVNATVAAFEQQAGVYLKQALAESGRLAKDATLLAFGGGGPMIVCGIAEAAGICRVIVPRLAAVFSAFGIGFSNLAHEYQAPISKTTDLDALSAELLIRARRDMYGEGVDPDACRYEASLWQAKGGAAIERPLAKGKLVLDPRASDARLTMRAIFVLPTFKLLPDAKLPARQAIVEGKAEVRLGDGKAEAIGVLADAALTPGQQFKGPVLVRGDYLTCLVKRGWTARITSNNDYLLEVG
jgi:N-methylhydantoinase A